MNHFRKVFPIAPLQNYVRYFWILEDDGSKFFKVIPDGLPGLVFQEHAGCFRDKDKQLLPRMFVYGQTTSHGEQQATARFRNIGVYLQPTAIKSLFHTDACELTDRNISIDHFTTATILEQLDNSTSAEAKIAILSNFLLKRIQQQTADTRKADFAIRLLQEGRPLKEIQASMNLSQRSLERLLKQAVGLSPKLYARIIRFQSGLHALRQKSFASLTSLAYQQDYFDQSHYIRDFKAFTGMRPTDFIHQTHEQVENFPALKK